MWGREFPLAVKIPQSLARIRIEELDLSVRSYNALRARQVKTLGQLVGFSDWELLEFKNLGRKSLHEIRQTIRKVISDRRGSVEFNQPIVSRTPQTRNGWEVTAHDAVVSPGGWRVPTPQADALDASVDLLDLSTRATNALIRLDLRTVRELLTYPKQKLFKTENIGRKSLTEIETKVVAYLSGDATIRRSALESELLGADADSRSGIKTFAVQMLAHLSERQRNVLADRYGLWDGIAETLQDIGDKLGLTRERIRQIESKALKRLRRLFGHGAIGNFIAAQTRRHLESDPEGTCGVLSEEEALTALAALDTNEEAGLAIEFLEDIECPGQSLLKRSLIEVEETVYSGSKDTASKYCDVRALIELSLRHREKPLTEGSLFEDLKARMGRDLTGEELRIASRILSISSRVCYLPKGDIALSEWKEFQRRDAPSVAEATLRLLGRPAHFREITLKAAALFGSTGTVNERTIQNALTTKRKNFVWVKPGTYGLAAWGLKRPPFIKDRLVQLLSETPYPLPYWHLKEKVLEECHCKEDSVRMTLDLNPSVFKKFDGDQYGLRSHYSE